MYKITIVDLPVKIGDFPLLCKRVPEGTEFLLCMYIAFPWSIQCDDDPASTHWDGKRVRLDLAIV